MIDLQPEGWTGLQRILVILAHPDDPEFFCGATLARWADAGHLIHYLILTQGDKGTSDRHLSPVELVRIRQKEQQAAAKIIGAACVDFLDYQDGFLSPSTEIRRTVVKAIRLFRPDILVTSDPTNYFHNDVYLNHPDHRAAGQIVAEAAFPASGNHLFFPELLQAGLEPHSVREVWITLTHQPNLSIDVTATWDRKIQALREHASQIGDPEKMIARQLSRRVPESSPEVPRFEDKFRRINLG